MTCTHDVIRAASEDGSCFLCPSPQKGDHPTRVKRPPVEDILEQGRLARIEQCKRSLPHFIRNSWHVLEPDTTLEWSWHIERMAQHVQWMLEQWMKRRPHSVENLIINVPPGSMKSLVLNVFAPAWMWLPCNAPHWMLLAISGSDSVVMRDAGKMRDLVKSEWYRESFLVSPQGGYVWEIRADKDAEKSFKNTKGGWRKSQTQSAKVTGDRFHALFVDDPNDVKDISEVKLKQVQATWMAAGNRLADMRTPIRVVIQQRTHEDDLSGHILDQQKGLSGTEHLCIPMEFTEAKCSCGRLDCDTTLGKQDPRTEEGEILHPERNTDDVIASEKLRLGPLGAAGQLNQRPSPLEGGMFKKAYWRRFDELPRDRRGHLLIESMTISVDATFKKTGSSRVCIMAVASKGPTRYVYDVVVAKMGITETLAQIKAMHERCTDTRTGQSMVTKLLIEDKANGSAIIELLSTEYQGVVEAQPNGDKMSRANAIHPQVAAGNVALLRDAPWVEEFIHEHGVFPNGKFDDIVDALSQVLLDMNMPGGLARTLMLCQA